MNSNQQRPSQQKFPRVLGIDFGTQRIGVAVTRGSLAVPLTIIDGGQQQQAISEIKVLCEQENIGQIVVGLSEKDMARQTQRFVQSFKQEINLPVAFADETLSSQQARAKLQQAKKTVDDIDHYAAALILQQWLDLNS